ncbi:MAG TPA: PGPGW domain-containing protein [Deltaproteobacteria bacterium]|nr:PGPGW domain-containing protein [Deltaproteobacteria bacterium]HPR55379.1 PGPGW domain-containing protein [Deltaproteobacteria bacterium]HXK48259.1 PGPGW domain-containing protein [Deltaproteobacteria bacterium]
MPMPPFVWDILQPFVAWAKAHPLLMTGLWGLSVVTFFGTLLAIPMMVVRMPQDYFLYDRADLREYRKQHPAFRLFSVILKNILGVVFIAAGIVMLFLPGQGVLTILIGMTLVSFPRKRALEIRLVRRPAVLRTLNWIREKSGRQPLILPPCIRDGDPECR